MNSLQTIIVVYRNYVLFMLYGLYNRRSICHRLCLFLSPEEVCPFCYMPIRKCASWYIWNMAVYAKVAEYGAKSSLSIQSQYIQSHKSHTKVL